ncbi:MAG: hypothetical protein AAF471_01610 [Myxococcota bacterium]
MGKRENPQITGALDIDLTLAKPLASYDKENVVKQYGQAFVDRHLLTACERPHLLYAGTYELFQALWDQEIRIVIFSTGIQERNDELTDKIVRRAFPDRYDEVRPKIRVCSREHCVDTENMRRRCEEECETYLPRMRHFYWGNRKKDLRFIVEKPRDLWWTVLVDDDPSYVTRWQEKNFLSVPGSYGLQDSKYVAYDHPSVQETAAKGKAEGSFCEFYQLFYAYGLLQASIKMMRESEWLTLVECLYKLQVKQADYSKFDDCFIYEAATQFRYYEEGLKALRVYNPDLKFMRREDFR